MLCTPKTSTQEGDQDKGICLCTKTKKVYFSQIYIKTLLKDPEGRVDIYGVMATEMDQTCQ